MGDPRQFVQPGERMRLAASQVNFLNSLMRPNSGFGEGESGSIVPPQNVILCRNSTGSTAGRWSVLGITGVEIDPSADDTRRRSFELMPCLTVAATTSTTVGGFVVTYDPIPAGKIGRCIVAGLATVKVDAGQAWHRFAKPAAGSTKLVTDAVGPAEILWRQAATGTNVWALVRLHGDDVWPLRLGKTQGAWTKGTTATIDLWESGTPGAETQSGTLAGVVNKFADVAYGKWVMVGRGPMNGWYLIAAEC